VKNGDGMENKKDGVVLFIKQLGFFRSLDLDLESVVSHKILAILYTGNTEK
jgi:hypothetical protein